MVSVRRHLRPGDLGDIVALHGRLYSREYGHDETFEAMVASSVVDAAAHGFPGPREGVWLVEEDGDLVGCLGLTDEGAGEARVRWFLLERSLRGRGLGRALLTELFAEVEESGYTRVTLETPMRNVLPPTGTASIAATRRIGGWPLRRRYQFCAAIHS